MISVVIPTLDEERTIGQCLNQFRDQSAAHEVIVVDGGSRDSTVSVVRGFPGVKLLEVSRLGRGHQMNRGARAARGDLLLFLHADTLLPPEGLETILLIMGQGDAVGGSFSLSFDYPDRFLSLYARFSRINHSLFTYGDQGLFIARHAFDHIGGFSEIPLMEDVEIQKRLRKLGRFVKSNHAVITSARRFRANGVVRQQLLNTCLVLFYHVGVSPVWLKRYYS